MVDAVRGLLVLLMCSHHALTLSGLPPDSWLYTTWLPRGWGTHGFVILSGFGIAYLLNPLRSPTRLSWAKRRAGQLLLIGWLSNLMFGAARTVVGGAAPELFAAAWWWNHAAFGEPFSISAVLFPTAALLAALPWMARLSARVPPVAFVGLGLLALLGAGVVSTWDLHHLGWARLVRPGLGGFPLLLMFAEGAAGYALGHAVREGTGWPSLVLIAAGVGIAAWLVPDPRWMRGWLAIARVALLAGAVVSAALALSWSLPFQSLMLLGRFPLMAFLGHRVIVQSFAQLPGLPPGSALAYWVLFGGAVAAVCAMACVRLRFPSVDRSFGRVWL